MQCHTLHLEQLTFIVASLVFPPRLDLVTEHRPTSRVAAPVMDFPNIPEFPNNVPTAPLVRLSLAKLRTDRDESLRLFESSKALGFFYLDMRGDPEGEVLLAEANKFFDLAPKFYELGRDELQKFDYKEQGSYFGYKGYGSARADEEGNLDRNEFYNIPKVDFLGISKKPFPHPPMLYQNNDLIQSYLRHCHAVVLLLLAHLDKHLDLPPGTLGSMHRLEATSGDQIRMIKSPPQPLSDRRIALGKHTDFGSITILFNRLGGLQILPPQSIVPNGEEPQWTYVKPLPGHCIINLGDAMVKFTNGLLRSNIHRVVSPPGKQANETRYSVVYFSRPEDEVLLKGLEGSSVIPRLEAADDSEKVMNSKDWIMLQAMQRRDFQPGTVTEKPKPLWVKSEL